MFTKKIKNLYQSTKFSFGSTSAIITNIALIIGLNTAANAKLAIIGSLLVIGLADNFSDSLGIHIYQESEGLAKKDVWILTFTNFFSRLIISLGFILIILFFPLSLAVIFSLIYGLLVLSAVSYLIALDRKMSIRFTILEHLIIAIVVIILSKFLGAIIVSKFK
jgi:vacuolar iron transporter family protein